MQWELISFYTATIIGFILSIGLIIDIKIDKVNLWPITSASLWGIIELTLWFIFYGLTILVMIGNLKPLTEYTIMSWLGLIMLIGGTGLLFWALIVLNLKESMGVKGEFCSSGPYGICRNPQSTGIIIQLLGVILMTYSVFIIILTTLHIIVLLLLIFAEEPWLNKHYGKEYGKYQKQVPYRLLPYIF